MPTQALMLARLDAQIERLEWAIEVLRLESIAALPTTLDCPPEERS